MSIINQALKKAQREQFLQQYAGQPQAGQAVPSGTRPWPLWLFPATILLALGTGAAVYSWSVILAPTLRARPHILAPQEAVTVPASQESTSPAVLPVVEVGKILPPPPAPLPLTEARPPYFSQEGRTGSPPAAIVAWQPPVWGEGQHVLEKGQRDVAGTPPAEPSFRLPPPPATPRRDTAVPAPERVVSLSPPPARQSPAPTGLYDQALTAQKRGETERARRLLEEFVAQNPTSKVAYDALGTLYYQQQQYQQAIAMYQQALEIDPAYVKARNNLGNAYMQIAMDEAAITELQQALQLDSSYGLAYYNLACLHARAGRDTEAAVYLQQAIALQPEAQRWAQTDEDFARVRTSPDIRQLLER